MITSIWYAVSAILLILSFMLYPKTQAKQNVLQWLAISLVGYELYTCLVGAVFTIAHIPADILSVAIFNTVLSVALLLKIRKEQPQKYLVFPWEAVGVIVLLIAVVYLGAHRFEGLTTVNYETSDPAVHMQMARDCVKGKTVISSRGGMIVSQFTNALWIEMLTPVFSGVYAFKLKDLYNFFLSGLIFYAAFRPAAPSKRVWQDYLVAVAYLAGYPLSNLLFGFQYLGLGVTACCFLVLCIQLYKRNDLPKKLFILLLNLGCLGSALPYTLFAPVVFIALFLYLSWDAWFYRRCIETSGSL